MIASASFNAKYFYLPPGPTAADFRNALSLGFDIETSGHVFQLHVTNAQDMIEKFLISENVGAWNKGEIYFGFNISRVFSFNKEVKTQRPDTWK